MSVRFSALLSVSETPKIQSNSVAPTAVKSSSLQSPSLLLSLSDCSSSSRAITAARFAMAPTLSECATGSDVDQHEGARFERGGTHSVSVAALSHLLGLGEAKGLRCPGGRERSGKAAKFSSERYQRAYSRQGNKPDFARFQTSSPYFFYVVRDPCLPACFVPCSQHFGDIEGFHLCSIAADNHC